MYCISPPRCSLVTSNTTCPNPDSVCTEFHYGSQISLVCQPTSTYQPINKPPPNPLDLRDVSSESHDDEQSEKSKPRVQAVGRMRLQFQPDPSESFHPSLPTVPADKQALSHGTIRRQKFTVRHLATARITGD